MSRSQFIIQSLRSISFPILCCMIIQCSPGKGGEFLNKTDEAKIIEEGFKNPPVTAKSGVYWYFQDGNLSREGITKDLESMARVGINHALFLEIQGSPRGKVDMLSPEWKDLFKHMVSECERLDVQLSLGSGPGWAGTGGPWIKAKESMKHLVSSTILVEGPGLKGIKLPKPAAKNRYYGSFHFTPELRKDWEEYYEDVAVLAFPTPEGSERIADIDEKSLYDRPPYSSMFGVKQFLPMNVSYPDNPESVVAVDQIMDITSWLQPDGTIEGDLPAGKWTIMRFGSRTTGAVTSPSPAPGLGFESDKMDTAAIATHLDRFAGELFRHIGFQKRTPQSPYGGLGMIHFDSWEMGGQNWTGAFREEFETRRGYDPQPYYPAYTGMIVGSRELSERFLWDLRKTIQELILENQIAYIRKYANQHGLGLSIEPYDMNPMADLELASGADVPMCEFWSEGYGFNTTFSAAEATSIAHLKGQPIVPAESFTAIGDGWGLYPGKIKNQTDWALAAGINRFMFHTFQHQSLPDSLRPGMTMGPIGVHWDRNQTWWEMGKAYHDYLSRCQFLLQQGRTVSDVLYFCPEGNPHVFRAPASAYMKEEEVSDGLYITAQEGIIRVPASENKGNGVLPDKKGYAFDACPPSFLYKASVKNGRIIFPGGAEYRILVLPDFETMTPEILSKIKELATAGATLVGMPPKKSPSLQNYPQCDKEIASLVKDIWGEGPVPETIEKRTVGKGQIVWGKEILKNRDNLYPNYNYTARLLKEMNIPEDFVSNGDLRYAHRTASDCEIYFVSNRSGQPVSTNCTFRINKMVPELWDALTGEVRELRQYTFKDGQTTVPLQFDKDQSFFIIFRKHAGSSSEGNNFPSFTTIQTLDKPWSVSFDPAWGGPVKTTFDKLTDWSMHENEGIKYYSGTAVYEQTFDVSDVTDKQLFLDLGEVNVMAKVWLNGQEAGTVWTYPWRLNISNYIKSGENKLKIEVVNLWINRLIGDDSLPYDGVQQGQWPDWMHSGTPRPGSRYTFSTHTPYNKSTPLSKSGLTGPVSISKQ